MNEFQIGETIICTIEIKDADGAYVDPETSITITVLDASGATVVDAQAMVKDTVGKYHYDYTSEETAVRGVYHISYKATDGTRVTKTTDEFKLNG